jgi:hypothetical protein
MSAFTGSLAIRVIEAKDLVPPGTGLPTTHSSTVCHRRCRDRRLNQTIITLGGTALKTIDPYLNINVDETAVFQTTTKSKTTTPKWNEAVCALG